MESPLFTASVNQYGVGMTATRSLTTAFAVVALLALSGCTPGTPTPSATPSSATPSAIATPTPTPTPVAPVAASVVVTATSISVLDASSTVIVDIPFTTNGDDAADQLALALGATPVETVRADTTCARPGTEYDFGGLRVDGAGTITTAPPAIFSVHVDTAATATGVAITGPAGVQVGDALADLIAAIPAAVPTDGGFGNTYLNLDSLGGAGGPDEIGMLGIVTGGVLVTMLSPVYIFGDC
jgi:hypothetical protein